MFVGLFDEIPRETTERARYAEPTFDYWNRTARQDIARVRAELENWFARYPERHQADLRGRFRSADDVQHRAAFFELFLHEMLSLMGAAVEVHPEIPGTAKRPEFRVTPPHGGAFYLEAKLVTDESKQAAAARKRLNLVYDAINELDSLDYWINVEVQGAPRSLVPKAELKRFLAARFDETSYEEVLAAYEADHLTGPPRWHFEYAGWSVDFFPIPKQRARGKRGVRPLGAVMSPPQWIDSAVPLREAIFAKSKRYGKPDLPFVIALNAAGEFVDADDVIEALFGSESWEARPPFDDFEFVRKPDGVWRNRVGCYTRVSACMVFIRVQAWNFPSADFRLYLHPNADRPISDGPLLELPHAVVVGDRLELRDGRSLSNVFGIAPNWLDEVRSITKGAG